MSFVFYLVSTGLIICTLLIYKLLQYIQNKDLGFDKNNLIVLKNAGSLGTNINVFKEELLKMPEVENASICNLVPPDVSHSDLFRPVGEDIQERGCNYCIADEGFMSTLKLTLVDGRFFSKEFSSDVNGVVINEVAARKYLFCFYPSGYIHSVTGIAGSHILYRRTEIQRNWYT